MNWHELRCHVGVHAQVTLAYIHSSAKLAQSFRLISLAEKKLNRIEEAEETLVLAMNVFKEPRLRTCLETLYAEVDSNEVSGQSCQSSFATVFLATQVSSESAQFAQIYSTVQAFADISKKGFVHLCTVQDILAWHLSCISVQVCAQW